MKFVATLAAAAAFAIPAAAAAQEAPATQAAPAAAEVTDEEIAQFAAIVMQGRGIENDTAMTDQEKQMAMIAIIEESDLELARFSEIAQALSADPALQQRLQAAVMQLLAQG